MITEANKQGCALALVHMGHSRNSHTLAARTRGILTPSPGQDTKPQSRGQKQTQEMGRKAWQKTLQTCRWQGRCRVPDVGLSDITKHGSMEQWHSHKHCKGSLASLSVSHSTTCYCCSTTPALATIKLTKRRRSHYLSAPASRVDGLLLLLLLLLCALRQQGLQEGACHRSVGCGARRAWLNGGERSASACVWPSLRHAATSQRRRCSHNADVDPKK